MIEDMIAGQTSRIASHCEAKSGGVASLASSGTSGPRLLRNRRTASSELFEWKTRGRGRSRPARNSDAEIADALGLAMAARTERAAVAVLTSLAGVEVPVASAGTDGHITPTNWRLWAEGRESFFPVLSKCPDRGARSSKFVYPSQVVPMEPSFRI
jgi:hypothetical protein